MGHTSLARGLGTRQNCRGGVFLLGRLVGMGWSHSQTILGDGVGVYTLACMTAGDWDRSDMELCLRESVPGRRGSWARESVRMSGPRGPDPGSCPSALLPLRPGLIISCRTELWSRASVTSLRDLDSCTTEYNQIKVMCTFKFNVIQHLNIYRPRTTYVGGNKMTVKTTVSQTVFVTARVRSTTGRL